MQNPNYKFIYGDMLNVERLKSALDGVDGVILLAGLVGDPITKKYPNESAAINDEGVKNVIDLCAQMNIRQFIFVSTCSNYGLIKDDELAHEEFVLNPLSLYAKSKVNTIRNIEKAMGNGIKKPSPSETKNIPIARKSIVAKKSIKKVGSMSRL